MFRNSNDLELAYGLPLRRAWVFSRDIGTTTRCLSAIFFRGSLFVQASLVMTDRSAEIQDINKRKQAKRRLGVLPN